MKNKVEKIKVNIGDYTIPPKVADCIAVVSMKDHRSYLKKELNGWRKNPKTAENPEGYWMHPDDVVMHTRLIETFDTIIAYYGDEL